MRLFWARKVANRYKYFSQLPISKVASRTAARLRYLMPAMMHMIVQAVNYFNDYAAWTNCSLHCFCIYTLLTNRNGMRVIDLSIRGFSGFFE